MKKTEMNNYTIRKQITNLIKHLKSIENMYTIMSIKGKSNVFKFIERSSIQLERERESVRAKLKEKCKKMNTCYNRHLLKA